MNSPIPLQQIASDVCVTGQLEPAAMAELARLGFKAVINNRPDFEGGPEQPTSASIEASARAAGLQYAYVPIQSGTQPPEAVARMSELLREMPRPLVAFCRSGARSTNLYRAASAG